MDSIQGGQQTIITEDVEITGTITAKNGLRVDGKLNGDLNCTSDVLLGKSGNVKGNVSANAVTVEGSVTGNITTRDRISLKAAARINGDVKAKRMTMEDGVSFVGKVEVNPGASAAQPHADRPSDAVESEEDKKKGGSFFGRK